MAARGARAAACVSPSGRQQISLPSPGATYPIEYGKRAGELIATERALVEPAKAKIAQRTLLMLQRLRYGMPPGGPVSATLADFFEQLWCYCNTVQIFTQRHTAGQIAWSHTSAFQRIGGVS